MALEVELGAAASPMRPLLVGDVIDGRRVAGFAWTSPKHEYSTHLDDRLLLDGDEVLDVPPDRMVPQTADAAERQGVMPPADLPEGRSRFGRDIDPTVPLLVDSVLDLPGAPWQPVARSLIGAVYATGHRIWLTGGTARDVVLGIPPIEVNDLDLTGTVPPGRFTDITRQTLRASRMSEYRTTITPTSLVCAVVRPQTNARLIEYRGLRQGGFRFPVVGSSTVEDARHRDFSFNALLYDVLDHVMSDADGTGVDSLLGARRRFVPLVHVTDPLTLAKTLIRAAKFGARWDADQWDLTLLKEWVSRLPEDLCTRFTADEWHSLARKYEESVFGPTDRQVAFAEELGPPGRELVLRLIGQPQ